MGPPSKLARVCRLRETEGMKAVHSFEGRLLLLASRISGISRFADEKTFGLMEVDRDRFLNVRDEKDRNLIDELVRVVMEEGDEVIRNEVRNSKSDGAPLVQIRIVLLLAGCSAVVWPTIAPSLTDHSRGLPSQPVRSVPLNML